MSLIQHRPLRLAALALLTALLPAAIGCHHPKPICVVAPASGGASPGPAGAGPALGSASTFEILGSSTVTNTGATTTVVGDVGVSTSGGLITGLPAGQPTGGARHAGDATALAAQNAVTPVYNDLAGRACGATLTGTDLGGLTLAPGVYCYSSSAQLTGTLTLNGQGNSGAVFVFKIGTSLTSASDAAVVLIGSAQAKNVFWQVGSSAVLGTNTAFRGNIIAQSSITLNNGSTITGRCLARTGAVTLNTNAAQLP